MVAVVTTRDETRRDDFVFNEVNKKTERMVRPLLTDYETSTPSLDIVFDEMKLNENT